MSQNLDWDKFYIGQEAVSAGLADGIDRVHLAMARENLQNDSVLIDKNSIQKWL